MKLIEKLICAPSDTTLELLFDDTSEVFWVDGREDDSVLADYCESIIESNKLSSEWDDKKLIVRYGNVSKVVPLIDCSEDRHITLLTINEVIFPDYEIRMVWDSNGSDTLAFAVLSGNEWDSLESKYGATKVANAFLRLSNRPNIFTDSLKGFRPSDNKKWWQFWR